MVLICHKFDAIYVELLSDRNQISLTLPQRHNFEALYMVTYFLSCSKLFDGNLQNVNDNIDFYLMIKIIYFKDGNRLQI